MIGAQIPEIEDRHFVVAGFALVLGPAESDIQNAFLRLGQLHQAREQQRPHLLHRCAHRMAVDAENIPEHRRKGCIAITLQTDFFGSRDQLRRRRAFGCYPRKIAFDVGRENGNAGRGKTFRQHLQRHGFAGAGRARDEAVAVSQREFDAFGRQIAAGLAAADEDQAVLHVVAGIGDGLLRPRSAGRSGHFHSSNSSLGTQRLTTDP